LATSQKNGPVAKCHKTHKQTNKQNNPEFHQGPDEVRWCDCISKQGRSCCLLV